MTTDPIVIRLDPDYEGFRVSMLRARLALAELKRVGAETADALRALAATQAAVTRRSRMHAAYRHRARRR